MIRTILSAVAATLLIADVAAAQSCHPGVAQLARGDYASALKNLAAAARNDATNASILNSRGVAELMNGKLDEAIVTFEKVLAIDPAFHEARFNRGIVLLRRRAFGDAAAEFLLVYEKSEARQLRARAAYHRAFAEDGRRETASAITWLERASAADPALSEAKLYRGVLLERQREFVKAGEAYREYLMDEPKSVVATLRFGVAAHRAGYPETARRYLKMVIDQAPQSVEAAEARKFLVMWE